MNSIRFGWTIFLLCLTTACTRSIDSQLTDSIRNYNAALAAAYRTGDTRPLFEFAGEKETNKIRVLIDIKLSNKLVLESELQRFEIKKITPGTDGAFSVRTKERWKYYDRSLRVGVPPGQTFVADIFLEYTMRKDGGSWKIHQVKAEKTDYIEKPQ